MHRLTTPNVKTLVITRPKADAKKLAATIKKKGFRSIVEPMLSIETLGENKKLLAQALGRKPRVILITSKHAVSALAQMSTLRSIPLLVVGTATAEHASALGFKYITTAGGTAASLISHVKTMGADGRLLYLRGEDISSDIRAKLARHKFITDEVAVYRALAKEKFSPPLRKALTAKTIDAVLFFSERTASTYVKLALLAELRDMHRKATAICLSKTIASKLKKLPWKNICVAAKPDTNSMLDKVNSLLG